MSSPHKLYFPGLNALRFFAALAVIICHVELIKHAFGIPSVYMTFKPIQELGSLGVYFFFVLSGFLITYLLLHEQEQKNTVSVRKFYMRRILRIWPLYFFIMALGFFILPMTPAVNISYLQDNFRTHYYEDMGLYAIILPNVAFAFFTAVPHIGHLWSIGVEEQFYLTWPWLFKKKHKLSAWLWIILVLIIAFKVAFILYYKTHTPCHFLTGLKTLIAMSKFENMAIGGLGAYYLYHHKKVLLDWVYHPLVLWLSILLVPVLIYTPAALQDGIHIVYSVLFLVIIVNVVKRTKENSLLESKTLAWLGNISYGLYMYHLIVIAVVCWIVNEGLGISNALAGSLAIYALSLILTIFAAHVSYRYFESFFLTLKNRFS